VLRGAAVLTGIDLCFYMLMGIAVLFAAVPVVSGVAAIGRESAMEGLVVVGIGLGLSAGAIAILIASRQSALLGIDIADTLLHEHLSGRGESRAA
jgi:hypothetical protein